MSNTIRVKRRASGDAGAPGTLNNAELAFNEVDDTLYYGKGTGGAGGTATTVEAIGGSGAFVTKSSAQTIAGIKTFSASPIVPTPTAAGQAVNKSYVDGQTPNVVAGSGIGVAVSGTQVTVSADATIARLASPALTGEPTAPTPATADNTTKIATTAYVKAQGYLTSVPVTSVAGKTGAVTLVVGDVSGAAPLASPALTGTPTAPTAATATNSTQIATTAFVQAAVSALIDAAPGTLDTLNEIAAALGDDPNFAATITTELATKMVKANNLSDLTNAATARTNLGLGSIATQAASAVAITGGSITNLTTFDGITIDGGTF